MRGLVVYYSRTGTTRKVAKAISNSLKYDDEEIITTKNRKGLVGYLLSGKEAILKKLAKIKEQEINPALYDTVIIGTPIWAFNMSSPVRAYINKNKFKKVAFFCIQSGSGVERAFKEMSSITEKKPIATLELKTKDVMNNNHMNKVNGFVSKLK